LINLLNAGYLDETYGVVYRCVVCGEVVTVLPNRCPICGNPNDNFTIYDTDENFALTGLVWNNGDGTDGGINQFTVNGIILNNNTNDVSSSNFDSVVAKEPDETDATAIYTVTESMLIDSGVSVKIYDITFALYENGAWKGYSGSIPGVDSGGDYENYQALLTRLF